MIIYISEEEVALAKKMTAEFDEIKEYDKFKCNNNYIGLLGEMVLHRYLTEQGIKHDWIDFIKDTGKYTKKIYSYPDFIINGVTYDLKTTYSDGLWFQLPIHDVYIYAKINKENTVLQLKAYATKEELIIARMTGKATKVVRGSRKDWVIKPNKITHIDVLLEELKNEQNN